MRLRERRALAAAGKRAQRSQEAPSAPDAATIDGWRLAQLNARQTRDGMAERCATLGEASLLPWTELQGEVAPLLEQAVVAIRALQWALAAPPDTWTGETLARAGDALLQLVEGPALDRLLAELVDAGHAIAHRGALGPEDLEPPAARPGGAS